MPEVKDTQLDDAVNSEKDSKTLYELSFVYKKQQNYTKALELLNTALQRDSNDSENSDICYEIATIYEALNLTNKALNNYKESIKFNQKKIKAYHSIASILSQQKQYNSVIVIYNMVLEFDKENIEANFGLAVALYKSEEYGESILYFEKVLYLDNENIEAYKYLCSSYTKQKRFKEALVCNLKAIELYPNESKYHYNLAVTFENLDEKNQAIESLHKAVELNPNYTEALSLLVKLKNRQTVINVAIDWGSNISLIKFAPLMLSDDLKVFSLNAKQGSEDIRKIGLEDEDISQELIKLDDLKDAIAKVDIVVTANEELAKVACKMDRPTWIICDIGENDYLELYPKSRIFHCANGYDEALNDIFDAFEQEYKLKLKRFL